MIYLVLNAFVNKIIEESMSRRCELSGVGVLFGNKVSHSERKTRRKFKPNLASVLLYSELLKSSFRFRLTTRCIRSVEKIGGLDEYLIKSDNSCLSTKAVMLKRQLFKLLA